MRRFSLGVLLAVLAVVVPARAAEFLCNGVTSHRGNSADFPENTLPAFANAMQLGADWIELDVFPTQDGQLVISHDRQTGRVGDVDLVVPESTYQQLQAVDVATLYRRQRGLSVEQGPVARMPLLRDALQLVMRQHKTRLSMHPKLNCVPQIVSLVNELGAGPWVGFNDSKLETLATAKRLLPAAPVFWDRLPGKFQDEDIAIARQHGFETLVLHHTTVTPQRVAALKQAGLIVGAWTVNDRYTMRRLLAMGVARIYTDFPATLLTLKVQSAAGDSAASAVPGPRSTVRLLTIGNSFSANATRWLGDLAKAGGQELIHRPIVVGGSPLALHWGRAELYERDPGDPKGKYGQQSLKELLAADTWDFVTIQQYSFISHDPATYRPYARRLRDYVAAAAPQAEVLVHQTWAYRKDDPRFTKPPTKPGEPPTQTAMYQQLTHAYEGIATELGLRMIPVGDAFNLADSDPQWSFRGDMAFDPARAVYPALPRETHSLHTGWRWLPDKAGRQNLKIDGHHANRVGEYLGACVFYEMLFDRSVVDVEYVPEWIDPAYARFLRETAHRAVQKRYPCSAAAR